MLVIRTKFSVPNHPPFTKAGVQKRGRKGEGAEQSIFIIHPEGLAVRNLVRKEKGDAKGPIPVGATLPVGAPQLYSHVPRGSQMAYGDLAPHISSPYGCLLKPGCGSWRMYTYMARWKRGLGEEEKSREER